MKLKSIATVAILFVFACFVSSTAWASSDIVVRARTDKMIYRLWEPVELILEVENLSNKPIKSADTYSSDNASVRNLFFILHRIDERPGELASAVTVGNGWLKAVALKALVGKPVPFIIPPRSTVTVGQCEVFSSAGGPYGVRLQNDKIGTFILEINFSGKTNSGNIGGSALVTFKVVP